MDNVTGQKLPSEATEGVTASARAAGPKRWLRRLGKDTRAATAVEFALVAGPFLGLIFIILNSALMLFANAVMQGAVTTAARLIQTGQFQYSGGCPPAANAALTAFENTVCTNTFGQLPCGNIIYDVRTFSSFSAITLPTPGSGTQYCFNTGGAGAIVAVRVIYNWNNLAAVTHLLGGPGQEMFQYTIIQQNEPF